MSLRGNGVVHARSRSRRAAQPRLRGSRHGAGVAAPARRRQRAAAAALGQHGPPQRGRRARGRRGGRARAGRSSSARPRSCSTRPTSGAGRSPSATRSRRRSRELGGGADVYYAGKAFLCTEVARWIAADGLRLDTCSGGELAVALRGGVPPERIALHGNNKSDAEIDRALRAGIGRIVIDSLSEIDRLAGAAGRLGVRAPVLIRVTVGVEAHTHEYIATAHEDQKFGHLAGRRARRPRRCGARWPGPSLSCAGCTRTSARRSSTPAASRWPRAGCSACTRRWSASTAWRCPSWTWAAASASPTPASTTRCRPRRWPTRWPRSSARSAGPWAWRCPGYRVEPGRAIAGPSTFTLYRAGTIKDVLLEHGMVRRYVAVDGGMSDNIRTAAVRRRLLLHAGLARVDWPRRC